MATYQISDPSGATYQVDAPDNASQADVLNFVQNNKASAGNNMGSEAAGVQGFNATVPFGEKIAAGLGAVGAKAYDKVTGSGLTDDKTIGQMYDEGRADQATTAAANPKSYIGGMAVGLVPSILAGGAAADATGLSKLNQLTSVAPAVEGAGTAAKLGNLALRSVVAAPKGAAVGAVYGAGSAAPGQMEQGAVSGAKTGAVLGAATPAVSDAVGAIKDYVANRDDQFLQDLITPRAVGNVRKDMAANSTQQGLFNKTVVEPTAYQQQVMNTVKDTGVSRGASDLGNRQTIEGALGNEAQNLRQNISGSKVIYAPQDMSSRVTTATQQALSDEPLLVGDGERYLDMAADKMNNLVKANPGTPEGLLDSRQQFDQWVNSKGGFGDKDTAFRKAVSVVRGAANQYLGDMVPTAAVKDSLTKQSHMYDAIDALNSKIAYMPTNSVARALASPTGKALKYGAYAVGADVGYHKISNMLSSTKGDDE